MSEHPQPLPQPLAHPLPRPLPRPLPQKRSRSWAGVLVLVLLIALMLTAAYAVTLAPEHYAQTQATRVDGATPVGIGDPQVATIVPADEWSIRPLVTPLIGELQLFKNPAVIFGQTRGVQIESPDGMLTVTCAPLGEADPAAVFAAEGQSGAPVQEEQLVTGLTLQHVNTGEEAGEAATGMVAVITPAGGRNTEQAVLVHIRLSDDAKFDLDDYRPALSALLETVRLEQ